MRQSLDFEILEWPKAFLETLYETTSNVQSSVPQMPICLRGNPFGIVFEGNQKIQRPSSKPRRAENICTRKQLPEKELFVKRKELLENS